MKKCSPKPPKNIGNRARLEDLPSKVKEMYTYWSSCPSLFPGN